MVQPLFPVDSPPPCTIQVQQIVTNLISTGGAPQAQCERCGGWPEFLSGWLLHTGAAGSCHLRTTSTQEARRHATRRRGRAGAIAARPGSCWSSSHPVQAKTQQKPTTERLVAPRPDGAPRACAASLSGCGPPRRRPMAPPRPPAERRTNRRRPGPAACAELPTTIKPQPDDR